MNWKTRMLRAIPGLRRAAFERERAREELEALRRNVDVLAEVVAESEHRVREAAVVDGDARRLTSRACSQDQFSERGYREWCTALGEAPKWHRKQWEFCFIARAFAEAGLLAAGVRALGFGVGDEPLPALFASRGVDVLATTQDSAAAAAQGWAAHGQSIAGRHALARPLVCDADTLERRVAFRAVDMNAIPADLRGFDALWSACALEHLGSLALARRFVVGSLTCLRPGGVAVHTTELTLSSNERTIESGPTVLFRRRDVEELVLELERAGHRVAPVDWSSGTGVLDHYVDTPPYRAEPHLRLLFAGHVCTSLGLIVRKAEREHG